MFFIILCGSKYRFFRTFREGVWARRGLHLADDYPRLLGSGRSELDRPGRLESPVPRGAVMARFWPGVDVANRFRQPDWTNMPGFQRIAGQ